MTKAQYSDVFVYNPPPVRVGLNREVIRATLENIRDQLLRGEINGGKKRLRMEIICEHNKCGTAACIGGWASILLIGNEVGSRALFDKLIEVDNITRGRDVGGPLHELFYSFDRTTDYNLPNVAATAIQRYLDGERQPWPRGKMPGRLRYRYKRKAKVAAKAKRK